MPVMQMESTPAFELANLVVRAEYWEYGGETTTGTEIPEDGWLITSENWDYWAATTEQIREHYTPVSIEAYRELKEAGEPIPEEMEHVLGDQDG